MSRILIIGGTGSLGKALLSRLNHDYDKIMIFSREELKQKLTQAEFPGCNYCLGDVKVKRDVDRVISHFSPHVVFDLAAQKHVEVAESNPEECVAVNIGGTMNVAEACIRYGVKHMIFSSTDKAVLPINVYGHSKAISEHYLFNLNNLGKTQFSVFRWGNVCGSRGSVLHLFAESLRTQKRVYLTDMQMTRFWIHLDDVAKFMLENYQNAPQNRPCVPNMKAASLVEVIEALADYLGITEYDIETIGVRPGEKYHECLISDHEHNGGCVRSDTAPRFTRTELIDLISRVL